MINNCPVCEKTSFSHIFENNKLPIYNLQKHSSLKSALAAKSAKVKFIRCINCGFVFNSLFFQNDYDADYESGRSNSKKF